MMDTLEPRTGTVRTRERKIRPADPSRPTDELFDDDAETLPLDWPRPRAR